MSADDDSFGMEGVTSSVAAALHLLHRRVVELYGERLVAVVLFGSRARGDAVSDSDVDVAIVLDEIVDRATERNRLADAAYDAVVEHSEDIQPWPISRAEWLDPSLHRNPPLVRAMHKDGRVLSTDDDTPSSERYPDISEILERKAAGRRKASKLTFGEKIAKMEALRERLEPFKRARKARKALKRQPSQD